eukprot:gene19104-51157_t
MVHSSAGSGRCGSERGRVEWYDGVDGVGGHSNDSMASMVFFPDHKCTRLRLTTAATHGAGVGGAGAHVPGAALRAHRRAAYAGAAPDADAAWVAAQRAT